VWHCKNLEHDPVSRGALNPIAANWVVSESWPHAAWVSKNSLRFPTCALEITFATGGHTSYPEFGPAFTDVRAFGLAAKKAQATLDEDSVKPAGDHGDVKPFSEPQGQSPCFPCASQCVSLGSKYALKLC
jgi:hypothetical protein